MPRVSFHPPFIQIEADSKSDVFSMYWGNRAMPQLKHVCLLSVQTETPEGGVVVRGGAFFSG
jgi:hypothetical protein